MSRHCVFYKIHTFRILGVAWRTDDLRNEQHFAHTCLKRKIVFTV